jgi:hypothetical protein
MRFKVFTQNMVSVVSGIIPGLMILMLFISLAALA